jgi:hypothetical protein
MEAGLPLASVEYFLWGLAHQKGGGEIMIIHMLVF